MSPRPCLLAAAAALLSGRAGHAFVAPAGRTAVPAAKDTLHTSRAHHSTTRLRVTNPSQPDAPKTIEEDAALQWELFTRHHALDGEWWGEWCTYNYMGDLEDKTVAG